MPKVFLAGTPLQEFWDTSGEMLFAGPWCASYGLRGEWNHLKHRILPDPWPDLEKFRRASADCREFSDRLRGELAGYLNKVLGVSRGAREWRILLDPWLTYNVEQMYDHYVHVENAFKLEPDLRSIVLHPGAYETPRDTDDFVRMKTGPDFHLQMFSWFVAAKLPGSPTRRPQSPEVRPARTSDLKTRIKGACVAALSLLPGAGEVLFTELGPNRDEQRRLILGARLKALPFFADLPEAARPAPKKDERRLGLSRLPSRNEFERLFIEALPYHLPTVFLEGHAAASAFARSYVTKTPKIVFTGTGWHYTDAFKFVAAECAARGSRLWGLQHGGGYGVIEYSPAEVFERDITDRFYSWGWSSISGDPKVRDLPPPMLSRGGALAPLDDILLVCNAMDVFNIRLVRRSSTDSPADYIRREARFLNALPENMRPLTATRLPRRDWGWQQGPRLKELCTTVRFDDPSTPFGARLRSARLVVFDCPETTFLEALAADIPSVLTWDPLVWPIRPQAQPFFDRLKKVGILFDSPEDAAAQAARVYPDPRAWWNEPERRAATREFTRLFARSSPDWLSAWLQEIAEGVAEK